MDAGPPAMIHVPMRVSGRTCWRIISIAWIASCTPFTALIPFKARQLHGPAYRGTLAPEASSAKNCELGRRSRHRGETMMAKSYYSLKHPFALHISTLQPIASSSGVPIISMSHFKSYAFLLHLCSVSAANTLIEILLGRVTAPMAYPLAVHRIHHEDG